MGRVDGQSRWAEQMGRADGQSRWAGVEQCRNLIIRDAEEMQTKWSGTRDFPGRSGGVHAPAGRKRNQIFTDKIKHQYLQRSTTSKWVKYKFDLIVLISSYFLIWHGSSNFTSAPLNAHSKPPCLHEPFILSSPDICPKGIMKTNTKTVMIMTMIQVMVV
jgi:hypothetical protein